MPQNMTLLLKERLDEYLGLKVERLNDISVNMSPEYLVVQFPEGLAFNERVNTKATLAATHKILHVEIKVPPWTQNRTMERSEQRSIS